MSERDRFRFLARIYENLEWLYSGGAIPASKTHHWAHLRPGMRIAYIGVGAGGELVGALAHNPRVTVIDQSPAMLAALRVNLTRLGLAPPEIICRDVRDFRPERPYDMIITHYFLNLYDIHTLEPLLDHLADWLKPGGLWSIADFAPYTRMYERIYWFLPLLAGTRLTGEMFHPFYDYEPLLADRGFRAVDRRYYRIARWGPRRFRALTFQRAKSTAGPLD